MIITNALCTLTNFLSGRKERTFSSFTNYTFFSERCDASSIIMPPNITIWEQLLRMLSYYACSVAGQLRIKSEDRCSLSNVFSGCGFSIRNPSIQFEVNHIHSLHWYTQIHTTYIYISLYAGVIGERAK